MNNDSIIIIIDVKLMVNNNYFTKVIIEKHDTSHSSDGAKKHGSSNGCITCYTAIR